MYEAHFGLKQRPFRATPESECYYPASSHELGLKRLLQAIEQDEGLIGLTGAPGVGKTLLCHCLLERLEAEATTTYLTNSHFGDCAGLLQAILFDLSLPHDGRSEQDYRLLLTDFLLKNYAAGRRTLLVIDEAQHLDVAMLEELRMLGNLEGRQGKALQVLLVAQLSLAEKLKQPELAAFRQRLASRVMLEPLTVDEAKEYVAYHLRWAGGKPDQVVSAEALEILTKAAHGVPRLLNQATHLALLLTQEAGATQVDAEAALEALTMLGLELDAADESELEPRLAPVPPLRMAQESELEVDPSVLLPLPDERKPTGTGGLGAEATSRSCRLFTAPGRTA